MIEVDHYHSWFIGYVQMQQTSISQVMTLDEF